MTRPSDPVQYAKYLRDGNVIEIGTNRYEVKGGTFVDSDVHPLKPYFSIELELISVAELPPGAEAATLLKATLIVDPKTIIPVLE